jgi:hypothetical protein
MPLQRDSLTSRLILARRSWMRSSRIISVTKIRFKNWEEGKVKRRWAKKRERKRKMLRVIEGRVLELNKKIIKCKKIHQSSS